jgi:hypothetical protein
MPSRQGISSKTTAKVTDPTFMARFKLEYWLGCPVDQQRVSQFGA